jgi:hypothetical protein
MTTTVTEWLPELTDDDLDVLVEALEAWESKDVAGEMLGDVVESMLTRGDPVAVAKIRDQRQRDKYDRERARTARKERSVLLRAKLLTLRDRRRVEQTISRTARDG